MCESEADLRSVAPSLTHTRCKSSFSYTKETLAGRITLRFLREQKRGGAQ